MRKRKLTKVFFNDIFDTSNEYESINNNIKKLSHLIYDMTSHNFRQRYDVWNPLVVGGNTVLRHTQVKQQLAEDIYGLRSDATFIIKKRNMIW